MIKNDINCLDNPTWLYLNTGVNDGVFNMSCDAFLLKSLLEDRIKSPVLRVYGWDTQTISLGASQSFQNSKSQYPIVKRTTGGQAVLHGIANNELTYSVCLRYGNKIKQFYHLISVVLISFLRKYGLDGGVGYSDKNYLTNFNCFESTTSADIVVSDVKVIGSAQYRKKEYILQHGSIKLDKIRKLSGKNVFFDQAALDLKHSFEIELNICFENHSLTPEDCEKINCQRNKVVRV